VNEDANAMKNIHTISGKTFLFTTAIVFLIFVGDIKAQIFFPDFTSVAGLNFLGNAFQFNNRIRLTVAEVIGQTSAVWDTTQQEIQSGFQTTFQFQITRPAHTTTADGFAFVIQNDNINALGTGGNGSGENIGFSTIPNCLAIKFDTFQNGGDPNNNFISVQSLGTQPNSASTYYSLGYTSNIPQITDGNIHTIKIVYSNDSLNTFFDDMTTAVLVVRVKIDSLLNLNNGKAWVGFTASTGAYTETADILNWNFGGSVPKISSLQQQTLATLICNSIQLDTVYVHDIGASPLSISSSNFAQGNAGYNVISPNNYPVSITPGDSVGFVVQFAPQTQGTFNDTLLLYNNDTITGHDPWRIAFSGKRDAIALQAPALSFGNVAISNFPVTKTLTVTNTGSLPVTISAGYFNGAAPFVIVSGIPTTISPGGSAQIVVRFVDPGLDTLYSDTMHFIFSPECSPFSALITGSRGNTPPVIQTSVQSVSNEIPCGAPVLDTVFITNAGGTPLLLSSASFVAGTQGFSVVTPTAFPVSVPPNDSTMFIVLFQPSGPGAFSDTLLIADNDTISSHNPWRIAFTGKKDTAEFIGTLSTTIMQAAPGDTILVPIVLQSPNPVSGVQLTMHIRYNASVLLPISAKDGTIDSIGTGVMVLTSNGNNTTDTIAWVKFFVALGDSVNSSITFDTLLSGNCPVAFSQSGGGVQLTGLCQQGGTRLFVNNGTLSLSQNAPNPFSSTTFITFSTIESSETRLVISNVLGQAVATLMDGKVPVGLHTVSFDASTLRSGTYYYTLQTPTQSLRKAMVIAK
jgi:hypothetical protein